MAGNGRHGDEHERPAICIAGRASGAASPADMGWSAKLSKQFAPRISRAPTSLARRPSFAPATDAHFDIGVLLAPSCGTPYPEPAGSGQTRKVNATQTYGTAFNLAVGPPPNVFPVFPRMACCLIRGHLVRSKVRPPDEFPTIDAWNLEACSAHLTPTTHTDRGLCRQTKGTQYAWANGDSRNTNPNEAPSTSRHSYMATTARRCTMIPSVAAPGSTTNPTGYRGQRRHLHAELPAALLLRLSTSLHGQQYVTPVGGLIYRPHVRLGPTIFLLRRQPEHRITTPLSSHASPDFSKGLAVTVNYNWGRRVRREHDLLDLEHAVTREPDSNVRRQALTMYGSYDLPFGKGKQYLTASETGWKT